MTKNKERERRESQAEPELCLDLAEDVTWLVECLPSMHEGLDSIPICDGLDMLGP